MKSIISKIQGLFSPSKPEEIKALMIGGRGTGKTTLLYNMQLGKDVHPCPSIGFNV